MAAVQTYTEQVDSLYVSTLRSVKKSIAENIWASRPYFFWLRKKGKFRPMPGGREIDLPVEYADSGNAQWVTEGASVELQNFENLTQATYPWRYLVGTIVRTWQEDQKNRSKHKIFSLMESKINNVRNSLENTLETQLASTSGSSSNAFDGLQHLVQDDPTSSTTVGGINQSTHSWWQNQATNMTTKSFSAFGTDYMSTMMNNVSNNVGRERPDIILCGQTPFEYYKQTLLQYWQFTNKDMADAGFTSVSFEGIPMVWSPALGTRMYFLNTDYLWMIYDPAYYFQDTPWMLMPTQPNNRAMHITTALAHVTNRRRVQGVIYNIDTP